MLDEDALLCTLLELADRMNEYGRRYGVLRRPVTATMLMKWLVHINEQ